MLPRGWAGDVTLVTCHSFTDLVMCPFMHLLVAQDSRMNSRPAHKSMVLWPYHTLFTTHGRRSRGDGRDKPPEFEAGGLSPQILSCCKILSTRLLALQCRKMCFCLYSRTFIVSPAMRPLIIPVRSTPMLPPTSPLTHRVFPTLSCQSQCQCQRKFT